MRSDDSTIPCFNQTLPLSDLVFLLIDSMCVIMSSSVCLAKLEHSEQKQKKDSAL